MSELPEVIARRYHIAGRVQGVGFRAGTVEAARRMSVEGWARNLPDGRVEVHAQGDSGALGEFGRWLEHGPSWARVVGVEESVAAVDPGIRGFTIR